ncbi:MAG: hypothetical protein B0W54_24160 [Cellvibrio sp. 79]|nr:MAG: hypothetical protein B0W54_24160 [Cellvibrio sp. 79]
MRFFKIEKVRQGKNWQLFLAKCGFYNYLKLPLFFIYKTDMTEHKTALSIWFGQSSVNICKWQPLI